MSDNVVPIKPDQEPLAFADFWQQYPKKVAKFDAEKAWKKLTPAQHAEACTSISMWRRIWLAGGQLEFVPHAATWLNGHRWEDEPPQNWGRSHASQQPATLPNDSTERTPMPDDVRDKLRKFNAKFGTKVKL